MEVLPSLIFLFSQALLSNFCFLNILKLLFEELNCYVQHSAGQIRNRKSGTSAGTKSSEQGTSETITFADVAGVDEAKEELEEIVVG